MTIRVTLSGDVANYLEGQSLTQNKSCDQIADELLRRVIASERDGGDTPKQGEPRAVAHQSALNSDNCLNQTLDDLYIEDYLEKARR